MDTDILITSGNSDGKITQPMRTTSETILPVHFFSETIDKCRVNIKLEQIGKLKCFLIEVFYIFLDNIILFDVFLLTLIF